MAAVAVRFERQLVVRIGTTMHFRIVYVIGVLFATQTACETELRINLQVPFGVAFRTTSRTVPGTVPKVVPETSFPAHLAA
jgi:hypothetical protein